MTPIRRSVQKIRYLYGGRHAHPNISLRVTRNTKQGTSRGAFTQKTLDKPLTGILSLLTEFQKAEGVCVRVTLGGPVVSIESVVLRCLVS